jgi:hypothetical protein
VWPHRRFRPSTLRLCTTGGGRRSCCHIYHDLAQPSTKSRIHPPKMARSDGQPPPTVWIGSPPVFTSPPARSTIVDSLPLFLKCAAIGGSPARTAREAGHSLAVEVALIAVAAPACETDARDAQCSAAAAGPSAVGGKDAALLPRGHSAHVPAPAGHGAKGGLAPSPVRPRGLVRARRAVAERRVRRRALRP